MSTARRPLHACIVLVAAAFVAGGCGGGGEEAVVDPNAAAGATPTPGATDGLVTQPGATDPTTGLPVEGAGAGVADTSSATVPDLVGDDVSGLDPVSDATPLFDAQAIDSASIKELDNNETDPSVATTKPTEDTKVTETASTPSVTYTGAKIYVDGIVHTVDRNGSFPKANPVFKLLSVTASDIEIGLIAGEFTSSGGDGTFLDLGDMVSLVNSSEQVTYRVKYLRPLTSTNDIAF